MLIGAPGAIVCLSLFPFQAARRSVCVDLSQRGEDLARYAWKRSSIGTATTSWRASALQNASMTGIPGASGAALRGQWRLASCRAGACQARCLLHGSPRPIVRRPLRLQHRRPFRRPDCGRAARRPPQNAKPQALSGRPPATNRNGSGQITTTDTRATGPAQLSPAVAVPAEDDTACIMWSGVSGCGHRAFGVESLVRVTRKLATRSQIRRDVGLVVACDRSGFAPCVVALGRACRCEDPWQDRPQRL
jgi:hypothetical protein